ncbi:MAG: hypothetical protein NTY17_01410 [Planctomycetia bacterium]|nr:hypothetical protein [Planctomycetia bacterium]
MLRSLALLVVLATPAIAIGDEITMKNGQKVDGHVQALKDGHLEVGVFTGQYFGGFPAMATNKLKFSNVRSIKFDGRDDFFAIVKNNEEVLDARVYELSKGKFQVDGHDPISASSIKALVPSKPNDEGNK